MDSPQPPRLRLVRADEPEGPSWPPWVEDWVLPYVFEPALWPVLLALLGHVVVVIAPLALVVARTGSGLALFALVVLAVGSAALARWEWRVRGRVGVVTAWVVGTWVAGLLCAWGADATGLL